MTSQRAFTRARWAMAPSSVAILAMCPMPAAAAAPADPSASSSAIQEVIVTARKRKEDIQSTPIAVTAVATGQLEAAAAVKISDLQGAAPNTTITFQSTGGEAANISIRGISFADIEKSFDPAVGVNVDGVYIGTSTGQLVDFFDISSIEILRGPQGTLFGRNTIGGVIDVHRSRPTGEFGGKFQVDYSSFDTVALRSVVNVPMVKDVLAAKFFWFQKRTDGFYHNATLNRSDGNDRASNYGASLLFTPTGSFDALLTLERQVDHGHPVQTQISSNATHDAFCSFVPSNECGRNLTTDLYTTFNERQGDLHYHAPAATLEMNWDAGITKITSITSYRKSSEDHFQDPDAFSLPLYENRRIQQYHQFSQELRAAGQMLPTLDYVAGLYYFESKYHLHQDTYIFGTALSSAADTRGTSQSEAAFVDVNWQVFDKIRLSGGGRYTRDEKSNQATLQDGAGTSLLNVPKTSKSWTNFSPKAAIDYRPNSDLMVYASWSRGYRSGGFNGRGNTEFSASTPYGPEKVNAYEIGAKSEFLDRRLQVNLAAFRSKYKGIQETQTVSVPHPPFNETIVSNAAAATINGLELDFTARPIPELTIRGSAGLLDSKFHGFLDAGGTKDYSKVHLIYAPKTTASLSGEYRRPVSFGDVTLNASYRYLAPYDQQIAPADPVLVNGVQVYQRNDPLVRSDAQNLVDASLSVTRDLQGYKVRAAIFGRNLLDDRGPDTAFTVAGLWTFATAREPRTWGVQLGLEF